MITTKLNKMALILQSSPSQVPKSKLRTFITSESLIKSDKITLKSENEKLKWQKFFLTK